VVVLSDFWNQELVFKIANIVRLKGKPYSADLITIIISVSDCSKRDIIKYFKELQIDWPVVER